MLSRASSCHAGGPAWHADARLNIAVLGGDGGFDRVGVRTDTIMVVSIDVATGDAAVFSIPRNWERLPFPEGTPAAAAYPRGFDDIANAVYGLGSKRPLREEHTRIRDPLTGAPPMAADRVQTQCQVLGQIAASGHIGPGSDHRRSPVGPAQDPRSFQQL